MYKLKYIFLFTVIFCTSRANVYAQDPVFSQFYSSPMSVNPALAGNGNASWRIVGNNRSQWIGQGLDPLTTTSISFDGKLFKQRNNESNYIGGGLMFLQDKGLAGAYKTNSLHTYPMRRIWKILVAKEEPYKSKNLTNYINEIPGKSNCELKLRSLYSKLDIKKGDELLLDYPKDYNRVWLNKQLEN